MKNNTLRGLIKYISMLLPHYSFGSIHFRPNDKRIEVFTTDPRIVKQFFTEDMIISTSAVFIGYLFQTNTQLILSISTAIPKKYVLKDLSNIGIRYDDRNKYSSYFNSCIYTHYNIWVENDE